MSKEQQELVDEAYDRYCNTSSMYIPIWSQEQFINKCKTNPEFSEKWGLKIEERELSLEERMQLWQNQQDGRGYFIMQLLDNIPTKLITLTYNNETIESYE